MLHDGINSVVELCPGPDKPAKYYAEVFVAETVTIPPQKPDKDQIASVRKTISLEDVQTIEVILPGNNIATGNKIFVAGNIYLDVQYVSTRIDQTVHFVRFQLPFQTIILGDCASPDNIGKLIDPTDPIFGPNDYVVHVCVEKMREQQLNERTIYFEILLLVWVEEVQAP